MAQASAEKGLQCARDLLSDVCPQNKQLQQQVKILQDQLQVRNTCSAQRRTNAEMEEVANEMKYVRAELKRRKLYDAIFYPGWKRKHELKAQIKAKCVHMPDVSSNELPAGWIKIVNSSGTVTWVPGDTTPGEQFLRVRDSWHEVGSNGLTFEENTHIPGSRLHSDMPQAERETRIEVESMLTKFQAEFRKIKPKSARKPYKGWASHGPMPRVADPQLDLLNELALDSQHASTRYVIDQCAVVAKKFLSWSRDAPWGTQLAASLVSAFEKCGCRLQPYRDSEPWRGPSLRSISTVQKQPPATSHPRGKPQRQRSWAQQVDAT